MAGAPRAFARQRAQIWLRTDRGPHGPADTDWAAASLGWSWRSGAGQAGLWADPGRSGALVPGLVGRLAGGTKGGRRDCQGDSASDSTRNELQPWRQRTWCLKTAPDADFVCAMVVVLDTRQRPMDARHPVVCVDELSKTLHAHVRELPLPRPARWPASTSNVSAMDTSTCS